MVEEVKAEPVVEFNPPVMHQVYVKTKNGNLKLHRIDVTEEAVLISRPISTKTQLMSYALTYIQCL